MKDLFLNRIFYWRQDTQHDDAQHNDTQHDDAQHNDTQNKALMTHSIHDTRYK